MDPSPAVAAALVAARARKAQASVFMTAWRPRFGSAAQIARRHGSTRPYAGEMPRACCDDRSRRWWLPAISLAGDDKAPPPRLHRAKRSLHRGTGIAARAAARVRAQGVVARRARAFDSSVLLPPVATRAEAGLPRREHL